MTRITDLRVFDLRFATSQSLDGSDAMNPDPDYSAAYVILDTDSEGLAGDGVDPPRQNVDVDADDGAEAADHRGGGVRAGEGDAQHEVVALSRHRADLPFEMGRHFDAGHGLDE